MKINMLKVMKIKIKIIPAKIDKTLENDIIDLARNLIIF